MSLCLNVRTVLRDRLMPNSTFSSTPFFRENSRGRWQGERERACTSPVRSKCPNTGSSCCIRCHPLREIYLVRGGWYQRDAQDRLAPLCTIHRHGSHAKSSESAELQTVLHRRRSPSRREPYNTVQNNTIRGGCGCGCGIPEVQIDATPPLRLGSARNHGGSLCSLRSFLYAITWDKVGIGSLYWFRVVLGAGLELELRDPFVPDSFHEVL